MEKNKIVKLEELINRINELYHKQKEVGLTEEEKVEQANLRNEYRDLFRKSLRGNLDTIDIKEKDGSIHHPINKKNNMLS